MKPDRKKIRFRAALASWSLSFVVVVILYVLTVMAVEMGRFEKMIDAQYLRLALVVILAHGLIWAWRGWFVVIEGKFRHAEYGGTENQLRRILFQDGRVWELAEPLSVRFDARPGARIRIDENFLGANRIGVMVWCPPPWSDDGE